MLALRIAASFAIVALLLWMLTRASRGRLGALLTGSSKGRAVDPLTVLERRQVTRNAGVAIVRAGSRHLLVGISDSGVHFLAEGDDLVPPEPDDDPADDLDDDLDSRDDQSRSARTRIGRAVRPSSPRMSLLAALREKTVRRS